jgi:DNA replication protein DnaC
VEPLIEQQSDQEASSPSTQRARVLTLVERIAGHPVVIEEAPPMDQERDYGCDKCTGLGWGIRDVLRDHPDFGKAFPCTCMEPVIARQQLERTFGAAKVPPEYADASFASYRALPITITIEQAAAVDAVERWAGSGERSVLLWGPVGRGKTGLAVAAMRARIERDRCAALFATTIDLLDAIRGTYGEGSAVSEATVLDTVRAVPLLVLDDIGRERIQEGARGDWVRERLFAIVNHRQINHLATIFTSNKDIAELADHLGDATAWRIKQACWPNVVRMIGANLRDLG